MTPRGTASRTRTLVRPRNSRAFECAACELDATRAHAFSPGRRVSQTRSVRVCDNDEENKLESQAENGKRLECWRTRRVDAACTSGLEEGNKFTLRLSRNRSEELSDEFFAQRLSPNLYTHKINLIAYLFILLCY